VSRETHNSFLPYPKLRGGGLEVPVLCNAIAKRIGGGQARKRGKKGKPVAQRVTTTTA
jgi:hypothetical protein